jgi:hypothetical protein
MQIAVVEVGKVLVKNLPVIKQLKQNLYELMSSAARKTKYGQSTAGTQL